MLLTAAMRGHADVCQQILDAGVITKGDVLWQALRTACLQDHLHTADIFLKYNNSVNFLNPNHVRELLSAIAANGQLNILMWIAFGVGMKKEDKLKFAFVAESALGNIKTIQQMSAVIGITATDVMSQALWAASWNGRREVVNWLVTHTAASVSRSQVTWAPLGLIKSASLAACHQGHWSIATQLLQRCVSPHTINWATNGMNNTTLHCAIWCQKKLGVLPLHQACFAGDVSATDTLLRIGDVNMQDAIGQTPLHYACQGGHALVVKLLLSVFARCDIVDDRNNTAAQYAVNCGHTDMLGTLLSVTAEAMALTIVQSRQSLNDDTEQRITTGLKSFQQENIQKLTEMLRLMQQQEVEHIDEVAQSIVEVILRPRVKLSAEYRTALTSMLHNERGGVIIMKYICFLQSRDLFSDKSAQNCYQCVRSAIYELIADDIPVLLAKALTDNGLYDVIKEELLTVATDLLTSKQVSTLYLLSVQLVTN